MDIRRVESNIDKIEDKRYSDIIILFINAVKDFPKFNLSDVDEYLNEIRFLIGGKTVDKNNLEQYLDNSEGKENDIWVESSLASLIDAFDLMRFYKIEFDEILKRMKSISQ